jgi:hypothetical protein
MTFCVQEAINNGYHRIVTLMYFHVYRSNRECSEGHDKYVCKSKNLETSSAK